MSFCCKTPGFAAVVHDEDIPEMKCLGKTKRAELFAVPTGTQNVVYGLQGQLEMRERKNEELYNACTRTVLEIGNLPTLMVGDLQRPLRGIEPTHDGQGAGPAV